MPGWLRIATLGLCLPALGACGQGTVQDALGMGKRSPDEFAVISRAPLILPPDFDLRPPGRGEAPRPAGTPADRARETLTGGVPETDSGAQPASELATSAAPQASRPSPGQSALLRQVGEAGSDPEIRSRLADEGAGPAEVEPAMFERLMGHPPDDPSAEDVDGASPTVVRREQSRIDQLSEPEN